MNETNELLYQYKNGNINVTIYADGTKIREWPDDEVPHATHPESCDLKITQFCDLGNVCLYCHEESNTSGQHGDLDIIDKIWSTQYPGTELAIGGGNPLAHPELTPFLRKMRSRGVIPNLTVNMLHMKKFAPLIRQYQAEKLVFGWGISYRGDGSLKMLPEDIDYSNVVFHMILGVHTLEDCLSVISWCKDRNIHPKLLLLGYKTYGKGAAYYHKELQDALDLWNELDLDLLMNRDGIVLSFDNLAIKQLELRNKMKPEDWELFYQGDDGQSTFYCDAVKGEVARTSTSDVRFKFEEGDTILSVFEKVRLRQ